MQGRWAGVQLACRPVAGISDMVPRHAARPPTAAPRRRTVQAALQVLESGFPPFKSESVACYFAHGRAIAHIIALTQTWDISGASTLSPVGLPATLRWPSSAATVLRQRIEMASNHQRAIDVEQRKIAIEIMENKQRVHAPSRLQGLAAACDRAQGAHHDLCRRYRI
jgi:hypothetical protein